MPDFAIRVREIFGTDSAGVSGWEVVDAVGREPWVYVRNTEDVAPAQGWKLHVSATVSAAPAVLERALETLVRHRAAFKVAASPAALADLNLGESGLSQVGKFITVYPTDNADAVRLAAALDAATRGLSGPEIPSDRPLRAGSLVHYRYGGFDSRSVMTLLGEVVPAIEVDGDLVPDRRVSSYSPPPHVADPFVAAGIAPELQPKQRVLVGRYALIATLHRSPRGTVHLAIDVQSPQRCVVKVAHANAVEADGLDAYGRLRREADVLRLLENDPRFPRVLDVRDAEDAHLLVLEDVDGETLERHVMALASEGRRVPSETVLAWGRELASILETIHAHSLVYADLKSSNVIVTPEGSLRLLDLELAMPGGESRFRYRFGTRGYSSPQQSRHAPPSVADDVYALGALLYFIVTGAEPYAAPQEHRLLARSLELMNPSLTPGLGSVISKCLQRMPSRRYPSATGLRRALERQSERSSRKIPRHGRGRFDVDEDDARAQSREAATRLADSLHAYVERSGPGSPRWTSSHPVGGPNSPHLNAGTAGPLLVFAELVSVIGGGERRRLLADAARALARQQPLAGARPAGLYIGDAGIAAALLRAGQVLDDPGLIACAAERGREVASLPIASPDLFHGVAGRVRLHLLLWDALGDSDQLDAALRGGEWLLATAEEPASGELCWRIPEGYGSLSGRIQLGYAHGAAGIGDALLDLFAVSGEQAFRDAAERALRWLQRQTQPALDDGSGAGWPVEEGGPQTPPFWCHGATGIGRFLLNAAESEIDAAGPLFGRAARSAARGARWAGPTQCHGLAGNIEFLLDVYRTTRDSAYLVDARTLATLLDAFAIERDGKLVWPSEHPSVVSPDYMVGFSGIAACMVRLAEPETRPHLLTREGFGRARAVDFAPAAAKLTKHCV